MKRGLVNPLVETWNVSCVPGRTTLPGDGALIVSEGGGSTVIVCETLAEESLPATVKVKTCVPASLAPGTHENRPPGSMLFEDALEPPNESCRR